MPASSRRFGFTAMTASVAVSSAGRSRAGRPSAGAFLLRFHSSTWSAPSEFLLHAPARISCDTEHHLPGFLPSWRHHRDTSTAHEGSQAPTTFRPQAFSASRRFAPHRDSRACSIPQPLPGFTVQGLLPPCSCSSLVERNIPPCRWLTAHSPVRRPRPQTVLLDFEAFLRTEKRFDGLRFSLPAGRSPLRFQPPLGSPSSVVVPDYSGPSALEVVDSTLTCAASVSTLLQRFCDERTG